MVHPDPNFDTYWCRRRHGRVVLEHKDFRPGAQPPQDCIRDDWGNPFIIHVWNLAAPRTLYSTGPNGIDEFGRGDDVIEATR